MPIEVGIWRLGQKLEKVSFSPIASEAKLEDTISKDVSIISPGLMLIGRQVQTAHGNKVDMLAMNTDGNIIIIELKKEKTYREVIAQALDYAAWVQTLSYEDIAQIYTDKNDGRALEKGYAEAFDQDPPEEINQSHEIIIVATELDAATERIIDYLSDNFGVPINAVFFRHFSDNGQEYIARTWLIEPHEAESKLTKSTAQKGREPWNGSDYYVSFGEGDNRNWEDGQRYGFISAGGKKWYWQTLLQLTPGARVFVAIPGSGYVGVGIVKEAAIPVKKFIVEHEGRKVPLLSLPLRAPAMSANADDAEKTEYVVGVEWIKTLPREKAYWEKGMYANQNSATKLRNRFTLERLKQHFGLED